MLWLILRCSSLGVIPSGGGGAGGLGLPGLHGVAAGGFGAMLLGHGTGGSFCKAGATSGPGGAGLAGPGFPLGPYLATSS